MSILTLDEETHIYRMRSSGVKVPGISQCMKEADLLPNYMDKEACYRGKYVHHGLHLLILGKLNRQTFNPLYLPYLKAGEDFLSQPHIEVRGAEEIVYNKTINCAGTLDLLLRIKNDRGIGDWKTGKAIRVHGIQTAFYDDTTPGPHGKRWVIELNKAGKYKIVRYEDRSDYQAVAGIVATANWKRNVGLTPWREEGYYYGDY